MELTQNRQINLECEKHFLSKQNAICNCLLAVQCRIKRDFIPYKNLLCKRRSQIKAEIYLDQSLHDSIMW